jgi:hypothetical protein
VSENRVLRRILEQRGRKLWEAGEDCIMRSFITSSDFIRMINSRMMDGQGM